MLYGLPLPPSQVYRLAQVGQKLGVDSISVLIDNQEQLLSLRKFQSITGFGIGVYIKIDTGYHRSGLPVESAITTYLLKSIFADEEYGKVYKLKGFYSHAGHSYATNSSATAMELLIQEIDGLACVATMAQSIARDAGHGEERYVLSVGATPTAASIEYLFLEGLDAKGHSSSSPLGNQEKIKLSLQNLIKKTSEAYCIELHAGVYPFLDMQQLATKASPSLQVDGTTVEKGLSDIALTILAEVASVYPHRVPPEALIAAGSLALGREPCQSYDGWGIVSDWDESSDQGGPREQKEQGWKVARVSQEHGILQRVSLGSETSDLRVGQKVRIWPNHSCIAGAGFGFFLVVDSSLPGGKRDKIVDVWIRCRGW